MAFSRFSGVFLSLAVFFMLCLTSSVQVEADPNYRDALSKSIMFFQGQRSGRLPKNQRIRWRSNSGLRDGLLAGVDLTGGYYDAGDNLKFNFPMAFTTTMLSWSTIEFGDQMGPMELKNARRAIRWGTDYLLKCATATPGKLYVGVGDPNADHTCWERPEDMDTVRTVYSVSAINPGSDVAAETAAALAAASIVFRQVNPAYSARLIKVARNVMQFANQYRGAYSDSLSSFVCPFYCSYSGYKDDLFWGAAWLLTATNDPIYKNMIDSLGANDQADVFSWDNKFAGAKILLAKRSMLNKDTAYDSYKQQANDFVCKVVPGSGTQYTPGGLIYKMPQSNLQYATAITFLLTTYSKYMDATRHTFNCGGTVVNSNTLRTLAKKQVDYILGENPQKMSYMVGYGLKYPRRIHHRGSSLPSKFVQPLSAGCQGGKPYFDTQSPNPNILVGAVVGGPDQNDNYGDIRGDFAHSEPATYINAPFVGTLAYFAGTTKPAATTAADDMFEEVEF